jgi:predicted RNA-binding protein YlxR (DUF448 family)
MIRIVRTAEGVRVDPSSKMAGRGAYLHDRRECWERGLKGALANALKTTLSADERVKLEEFMSTLSNESAGGGRVVPCDF